ncbi:DUF7344 domain-containing protein [Halobaculum sp. EA56]|uniref:DUF7344 domain-containing protein n=1 Tax=Halobaculum sp. EA56 TaxID=3421648 RepID=UPI003EBB3B92
MPADEAVPGDGDLRHRTANDQRRYPNTAELHESDRHHLLESDRRRLVLAILGERTQPVELDTLAAAVAAAEEGVDRADGDAHDRVTVSLHHVHLPKLDDYGVIRYDRESNTVGW